MMNSQMCQSNLNETARYIRERNWHPSQKIEENEDGTLVLQLQTSGLGEVKRWLMQYGSGAKCFLLRVFAKMHR